MIIVSQDKEKIINFDNIIRFFIGFADENRKRSVRYEAANKTFEDLGIYETEERAKEVLKEIARFYRMFKGMETCNTDVQVNISEQIEKEGQALHVYTRPEE